MRTVILRTLLALAVPLGAVGCGGSGSSTPPQDPAVAAELKASMALKSAELLEKIKKTKEAVVEYRRVVKEHPGTPAAKTAAERLKALGAK